MIILFLSPLPPPSLMYNSQLGQAAIERIAESIPRHLNGSLIKTPLLEMWTTLGPCLGDTPFVESNATVFVDDLVSINRTNCCESVGCLSCSVYGNQECLRTVPATTTPLVLIDRTTTPTLPNNGGREDTDDATESDLNSPSSTKSQENVDGRTPNAIGASTTQHNAVGMSPEAGDLALNSPGVIAGIVLLLCGVLLCIGGLIALRKRKQGKSGGEPKMGANDLGMVSARANNSERSSATTQEGNFFSSLFPLMYNLNVRQCLENLEFMVRLISWQRIEIHKRSVCMEVLHRWQTTQMASRRHLRCMELRPSQCIAHTKKRVTALQFIRRRQLH